MVVFFWPKETRLRSSGTLYVYSFCVYYDTHMGLCFNGVPQRNGALRMAIIGITSHNEPSWSIIKHPFTITKVSRYGYLLTNPSWQRLVGVWGFLDRGFGAKGRHPTDGEGRCRYHWVHRRVPQLQRFTPVGPDIVQHDLRRKVNIPMGVSQ